jgi:hypothetical protein
MNFVRKGLALFSLAGALVAGAHAAPQNYATGVQGIRAGVVMLDYARSSNQFGSPYMFNLGQSIAPYAFYNLDSALGVKPAGWNLYNPHAPGVVTQDILNRWGQLGGPTSLMLGTPIVKQNAEYWSVYLDQTNDLQLSDYDVLLVNPAYNATLNNQERAKLTKFVDQGGILWIDTAGVSQTDPFNGFPNAFGIANLGNAPVSSNPFDPLLSTPYQLTGSDLNAISGPGILNSFVGITNTSSSSPIDLPDGAGINQYLGVTYTATSALIATSHLGDGLIVVTTMGTSQALGGVGNEAYVAASPALGTAGISAAKFAVNVISAKGDFSQPNGGARGTGFNPIDVTAPVLSRWSDDTQADGSVVTASPNNTPPSVNSAPVLYKGLTVVSGQNNIYVYDSNPSNDLDGDGDPDDGIYNSSGNVANGQRDYSLGLPYDLVWASVSMPGPISSPVCAQVSDEIRGYTDIVMVVDGQGTFYAFKLFPRTSNGQLIGTLKPGESGFAGLSYLYKISTPVVGFTYTTNVPVAEGATATPNAPTVSGDLAFITATGSNSGNGPTGAVWAVDLSSESILATGSSETFAVGNIADITSNIDLLPGYTASATVGDIPIQDNSGGYDKVIYAPGMIGSSTLPGFDSLWLGVKGESPSNYSVTGTTLTIDTRASGSSLWIVNGLGGSPAKLALNPRVTLLDGNGNALNPTVYLANTQPTQMLPGELGYSIANATQFNANVAGIRVDYTIDWGRLEKDQPRTGIERGKITFPVPSEAGVQVSTHRVLGPIALTGDGTAVMTVGDPTQGDPDGSLWWLREDQGRGSFRVTGRYSLYAGYNLQTSPVSTAEKAVFEDTDPIQALIPTPGIANPMTNWHWTGAPVVAGTQVIATATASKGFIPATVVMAFAAEPPTPSFTGFQTGVTAGSFNLVQPDFDRSSVGSLTAATGPDTESNVSPASSQVFYDPTSGTLSLPSLAPPLSGSATISECLNMSAPLLIQQGEASSLYQPEAHAGTWSPLHWYCVFDGTTAKGRPLVTGNTIFSAGTSVVPGLLTAGTLTASAVIGAMDASISQNDPYVSEAADRPWQPQVDIVSTKVSTLNPTGFAPDPHIKMPSSIGISSFNDYQTRLIQQTLGSSSVAYGIVGGGSNLAAWGNAGVYGLSRADFSICDNGRYLRTDSNGNPRFVSNVTLNTGPGGGSAVGNVKPLVRPTRAYPISNNQTLVVDPGSNRILKTDNSGSELRSLTHFIPDPNFLPEGYTANEPRTFSAPQDAITYSNYVYLGQKAQVSGQEAEEYWVHYLVADTGNHRLVELIDRYAIDNGRVGDIISINEPDPNATPGTVGGTIGTIAVPQVGVLLWQSPSQVSGAKFAYNSICRSFLWSNSLSGGGRYVYVAGVGNSQPQLSSAALDGGTNLIQGQNSTGNCGVVVFDPANANGGVQVYNTFEKPDLSTTPFWDPNAVGGGKFDTNSPINNAKGSTSPIGALKSVFSRSVLDAGATDGQLAIMITEATGVYEFVVDPTVNTTNGDLGSPVWFITNAAYTAMRGTITFGNPNTWIPAGSNAQQFIPAYAKRLDSGDVLIVNSYVGATMARTTFNGEVVLLNGASGVPGGFSLGSTNLGFTPQSIKFNLPQGSTGVRPILAPIFADRR